jgi:hypothetical protein
MTTAAMIGRSARYDVASHLYPRSNHANSRLKDCRLAENDDNTSSAEAIAILTLQLVQHTHIEEQMSGLRHQELKDTSAPIHLQCRRRGRVMHRRGETSGVHAEHHGVRPRYKQCSLVLNNIRH